MPYYIRSLDSDAGAVITSGMPEACRCAAELSALHPGETFAVHADGPRREGWFERDGSYTPGPYGAPRHIAFYRDGHEAPLVEHG